MLRLRMHPAAVAAAALVTLAACTDTGTSPTAPLGPGPQLAVSAYASQIVINEVMADPGAVADADGEWLEIHNTGTTAVNLQGWTLASNNDSPQIISSAVTIPAGGYAVLARNGSATLNGGITPAYAYAVLNLANTADWVALRDGGGASVDSVAWSTAMPAGASRCVSNPGLDNLDAKGANWHTSTAAFGAGDKGSPGARNEGKKGALVVRIIDAGQADAIFIENGKTRIILDAGQGLGRMADLVQEFGMANGTIDMMFMSHAHYDHHGGLREFFKSAHNINIPIFFENKDAQASTTLQELRDSLAARSGRGVLDYRDTDNACGTGAAICTFVLDGGAKLHVMRPKPTGDVNDRSVPLKLVGPDSASFTMWLSGDAEHGALAYFDSVGYDVSPGMNVDVVKGNHHGSCNGISSRFLDLTSPSWITFGVSATNGYHHVHTQTKTLLAGRSIPWYRSDGNGRITFTTPGTPGGGYTVSVEKGTPSMDGAADETSSQAECNNL
ncbi:lamin tail domain-containing protein [Longimicrobium sp.]|uniref:lamin tail domain-containing protein n=1 Tax=Longimicrobium sp. TaxID=2029185 RepID=UPI002E35F75C|nr:lamin tail domain-containing protein [Longimicrobium sp.]HEX6039066.1 lamin tail domain-containing protein [Longimicrobium sp.]